MRAEIRVHLADLKQTQQFAALVARVFLLKLVQQKQDDVAQQKNTGLKIYLSGALGAGKTAWVRALLTAMGVSCTIKSPSYSLVETYQANQLQIAHMDAYRLSDGYDFSSSGLEDMLSVDLLLIEWYERVESVLPIADWSILFEADGLCRVLTIKAMTEIGSDLLLEISK